MRFIDYEQYRTEMSRRARSVYFRTAYPRGAARRPRDPAMERLLTRLDRLRWQKALSQGRITRFGPRRYRYDG